MKIPILFLNNNLLFFKLHKKNIECNHIFIFFLKMYLMTAALQLYELIKRRYFEERWKQIFGDHLLTLYGQKKKDNSYSKYTFSLLICH